MSAQTLHVFAVNGDDTTRHTHLTRAHGDTPDLPPLADWLGVSDLDTDRIELFPIKDLEGVKLSDYVAMAFDPVPPLNGSARARLDALEGSVLLVPDTALNGPVSLGATVTEIATLPLAQPDHSADLPKADVQALEPAPEPAEAPSPSPRQGFPRLLTFAALTLVIVILFIVLVG